MKDRTITLETLKTTDPEQVIRIKLSHYKGQGYVVIIQPMEVGESHGMAYERYVLFSGKRISVLATTAPYSARRLAALAAVGQFLPGYIDTLAAVLKEQNMQLSTENEPLKGYQAAVASPVGWEAV